MRALSTHYSEWHTLSVWFFLVTKIRTGVFLSLKSLNPKMLIK